MSRLALLQEMIAEKNAGRSVMDKLTVENYGGSPIPDRILPWTPNERPIYKTPSVRKFSASDRVYKQPDVHQRFMRPMPAQTPVVLDATYRYMPNTDRVHTPHIFDRENFKTPSVIPRAAGMAPADYNASPEHIAEGGLAKLLTKPLDIDVPDSRDVAWLAERARLDAEGKPDVLPLGRKQLTYKRRGVKLVNEFTQGIQHAHDLKERVKVIETALKAGISKTSGGITQLKNQIAKVLIRNSATSTLSNIELNELHGQIGQLDIKTDWKEAGLKHRFWSYAQYKTEKASILLFLMNKEYKRLEAKGKKGFPDPKKPIPRYKADASGALKRDLSDTVDISFLNTHMLESKGDSPDNKTVSSTKEPQYYVDLALGGLVPLHHAVRKAREGHDNKQLNDFRISSGPSDLKTPDILPVGIFNPIWADKIGLTKDKQQSLGININPGTLGGVNFSLVDVPEFSASVSGAPASPPPSPKKKKKHKPKSKKKPPATMLKVPKGSSMKPIAAGVDFMADTSGQVDLINAIWHNDLKTLNEHSSKPKIFLRKWIINFPKQTYNQSSYRKYWNTNPQLNKMVIAYVNKISKSVQP